jgi:PIN domain nuclease of toxin-antitoxin system
VRLLLDTVTFIWAVYEPERISKKGMAALQHSKTMREISAISLAEIAIKQAKGKIELQKDDISLGISDLKLRLLSYTADHAFELFELPSRHGDPFDRQIIAQALSEDIPIVTPDEKFRLYKDVKIIW